MPADSCGMACERERPSATRAEHILVTPNKARHNQTSTRAHHRKRARKDKVSCTGRQTVTLDFLYTWNAIENESVSTDRRGKTLTCGLRRRRCRCPYSNYPLTRVGGYGFSAGQEFQTRTLTRAMHYSCRTQLSNTRSRIIGDHQIHYALATFP